MRYNPTQSILAVSALIAFFAIITGPVYLPALANPEAFNVSLVISNSAPAISHVYLSSNAPSEATTSIVTIRFNATDSNGVSDIPATNANIAINKSGVQINKSACWVISNTATQNEYGCNLTINYYQTAGGWSINASVFDGAAEIAQNLTEIYTINSLAAIQLKANTLSFSGTPGQTDVSASNNPQIVNNTGNTAFTSFNLTAYTLTSGSNNIGAGNFSANISNSAVGQQLANGTTTQIVGSSIAVANSRDLYIFVDVPATLANGTYASPDSWVVLANT